MPNFQQPYDPQRRPIVVYNLILINVVALLLTYTAANVFHYDLIELLGLYYPESQHFMPHQLLTHMFMHAGLSHLFFNMFALWMFGRTLELLWGGKRFLFFYLFTGLGAMGLHLLVNFIEISHMQRGINAIFAAGDPQALLSYVQQNAPAYLDQIWSKGLEGWLAHPEDRALMLQCQGLMHDLIQFRMDIPTVGASGAVYGVLMGFGMSFPNAYLYLLFPPMRLRTKWFVAIYALLEVYLGFTQPGSHVAHFAHIGGMLFAFLLIRYWQRHGKL